jgi:hypothetical protein
MVWVLLQSQMLIVMPKLPIKRNVNKEQTAKLQLLSISGA